MLIIFCLISGLYEIVLINESILEETLIFLKDQFFTSEAICKAIKVLENPALLDDLLQCMRMMITKEAEGSFVSIAVLKKLTNQIICVMCFSLRVGINFYFIHFLSNHLLTDQEPLPIKFHGVLLHAVYSNFNSQIIIQ